MRASSKSTKRSKNSKDLSEPEALKKQLIGFFGGTFDPIHFGHLNLALELKEKAQLDEVWFCPTHRSPLRSVKPQLSGKDRFEIVKLAVEEIPDFRVLDLEIKRPAPNYTLDTLKELQALYPNKQFVLILGEDALLHFDRWKGGAEIAQLVPLLIGCRKGADLLKKLDSLPLTLVVKKSIKAGLLETSILEISATAIRKRLKENLYCGHLLPGKVLDYIYQNQLYF